MIEHFRSRFLTVLTLLFLFCGQSTILLGDPPEDEKEKEVPLSRVTGEEVVGQPVEIEGPPIPSPESGDKPQAVFPRTPPPLGAGSSFSIHSILRDFGDEEIPAGLPPALDGFLVLLLQVAHIDAPDYASAKKTKLNLAQKVMILKSGVSLLRKVYGDPQAYQVQEGGISSIQEYLDVTEPTRGHSGSLAGDFHRLWYYVEKLKAEPAKVPRAYSVNMPNRGSGDFQSEVDNYQAQAYRFEMAAHLRRILASTALQAGNNSLSLMESVFSAMGAFITRTSNVGSFLNVAADVIENQTAEGGNGEKQAATVPERLRQAAGIADTATLRKIDEFEKGFMEFLAKIEDQDFDTIAGLISSFENSLNDIVKALKNVGSRIAESEQVKLLERTGDNYISELLKVLFDDYPKLLPAAVFKNIILDLFRTPKRATDIDVLMIMLRHFGPILKNFLQTSSRYQEMQALARVFESLQSQANKVVPIEVVEQIVAEDPNHYPITGICNLGGGEPKAGKFFQVHQGTMDGETVLVRVMLPDVENTLEFERLILLKLAEPLSKIYIRGHTDRQSAVRRMKRLTEDKYQNHKIELDIPLTVENQNAAKARLEREPKVIKTEAGPIKLSIAVPEAYPAVEGSRVMVTKLVGNVVDIKDVIEEYPEVARAAANYITELFYDELAFRPLAAYRGGARRELQRQVAEAERAREEAEQGTQIGGELGENFTERNDPNGLTGLAHGDLHGGNILFELIPDTGMLHFKIHLIDWGQTSWVRADQMEHIAVMAYGAEFNHYQIIAKNLIKLSNGSALSESEVFNIVYKKASELESKSSWWGPDEWICYMWIHGYLEFPKYLVALGDARHALVDLRQQLGHSEADTRQFMKTLYTKNAGMVIRRAIRNHWWHGLFSTKVPRRALKYQAIRCLKAIIGTSEKVDPLRG